MVRRYLFGISITVLICACSKNSETAVLFQGRWVEKTLRLDTFDFERGKLFGSSGSAVFFSSKAFNDTSLNPNYPVNNSSIYYYYVKGDSMFLHSSYSSSTVYKPYRFRLSDGQESFQIDMFYVRPALTRKVLEFEKIQ